MGISGIGKSTLLKLLLGVFNLNFGKIYLDTNNGKIPIDKKYTKAFLLCSARQYAYIGNN